jgi:uncharacterized FlaG/YvyC family protein
MRIDFAQPATQADLGNLAAQSEPVQRRSDTVNIAAPQPAPVAKQNESPEPNVTKTAAPQPSQLNVSLDDRQNVIYRFTDPANGEVIRQVPPEQILRIMRNIEDLLRESEQKLKVTL